MTKTESKTPLTDSRIEKHDDCFGLRELIDYYNDLLDHARDLETELTALRERAEQAEALWHERLAEIHLLRERLEKAERDAERWRKWRAMPFSKQHDTLTRLSYGGIGNYRRDQAEQLDAIIDQERKK